MLIIEHSVRSLLDQVNTLIALDHGQVIAHGEPGEVVSDPKIIEAYLGTKWSKQSVNTAEAREE